MDITRDYYKVLQIDRSASSDQVKRAFRHLALQWHPDRVHPVKKEEAELFFKNIEEAYYVLGNRSRRLAYDQGRNEDGGAYHYQSDPVYQKYKEEWQQSRWENEELAQSDARILKRERFKKKLTLTAIYLVLFTMLLLMAKGPYYSVYYSLHQELKSIPPLHLTPVVHPT